MALRNQVFIWIGLLVALIVSLWIFRGILLPFVVGAALAYLLNPLVNQLQKLRFNRVWATVVVLFSVLTVVISLFFMFVPLIGQQIKVFRDHCLPLRLIRFQKGISSSSKSFIGS